MYKCFCESCGHRFKSKIPVVDEIGFLTDISCPYCGCWDIYPDTKEGAAQSVKDLTDYENETTNAYEEDYE